MWNTGREAVTASSRYHPKHCECHCREDLRARPGVMVSGSRDAYSVVRKIAASGLERVYQEAADRVPPSSEHGGDGGGPMLHHGGVRRLLEVVKY